tara:strand:+ start:326 stop:1231 length:906 start_codon:yes stop_codon:yes gene_type:complete
MNILIYGFGRMGLTHYSILNSLLTKPNITFVEPNNKLRSLLKGNVNCNIKPDDNDIKNSFDLTLITSPPHVHTELLMRAINRGDKKIFVEKPFGGHSNSEHDFRSDNIYIGYVLRHNPIVQWIKKNVDLDSIVKVEAQFLSNTLQTKPKGWRNGNFSGVLNEVGSHIIDLTNYLFDISNFSLIESNSKSIISDTDDIVKAKIQSKNRNFNFYFNWVDKKIRKPFFSFILTKNDGTSIYFDQQKVEFDGKKITSVVDLAESVPFYLRGIDFTKQMIDLTQECNTLCNLKDATLVNKIMKAIK